MSAKHDRSEQAITLRLAARACGNENGPLGPAEWRALSRAAVAYAKLLLAGQCIPFPKAIVKEPKSK